MPPRTSTELRAAIVEEARSWIGTKFHDGARVKGAGVDCANLLIGVCAAVGIIQAPELEPCSPQWFLHHDEPRFLQILARYAHRVERAQSGDIHMYNFGRHAAHGAIFVDERTIIHAYKPAGAVVMEDPQPLVPRLHSFWSVL
jgi:cell wall-associated NlpC family hydrolase